MDIEIIEMAERKCRFVLRNSTPAMANALRRTLLTDIPKMAIDEAEFHLGSSSGEDGRSLESVTPLFDEVIAHRLGMIPVPTDYEMFVPREECSCGGKGCSSCTLTYSLMGQGPRTVLSGDMMPLGDSSLAVKDADIPIVELTENQSIMIYAHARMGTARTHVKWQAAFGVGYKYRPVITIDQKKAGTPEALQLADKRRGYPDIFDEQGGKLVVKNADLCEYSADYETISEGAVHMENDDTQFVFTFETDGSLTCQQVLEQAVRILQKETAELAAQVADLKPKERKVREHFVMPERVEEGEEPEFEEVVTEVDSTAGASDESEQ